VSRSTSLRWGLLAGVLVPVAVLSWWSWQRSLPVRPENLFPGGLPVASAQGYLGWEQCATCHAQIAQDYANSGHARTFLTVAGSDTARELNGQSFFDPERQLRYHYFTDEFGLGAVIEGQTQPEPFPLQFLLGSNEHAQTFLTLIPQADGQTAGLEHRVSRIAGNWALTPNHTGHVATEPVQAFGKVKSPETTSRCIGCHTTWHEIDGLELRHLLPNVQCEACHGPGAKHVELVMQGARESGIESLRATSVQTALAQIERCGVCHRLAEDLPPGQLAGPSRLTVRFQPVGLMRSRCYLESRGNLACSRCHNPHAAARTQTVQAIQACRACHSQAPQQQVCPVSPQADCIRCHMPPVEVHPGITFHDHWIRVIRPGDAETGAPRSPAPAPAPSPASDPVVEQ